jgi:hypothetical protein
VTLGQLVLFLAQTVPPTTTVPVPSPAAPAAAASGWSWSSLPTIIISGATAVGLARVLELLITRKSRSTGDQKVQVDAASVISTELRQWAAEANARAKLAEERAEIIQTRLQARVDELMTKLAEVEKKANDTEDAFDRLRDKIMACQAGPVCPVRTGDTNPGGLPLVRR